MAALVVLACHFGVEAAGLPLVLGGALVVSTVVNALILRLALGPLHALEATAKRVSEGDVNARVPASPVADVDLERLRQLSWLG